MTAPAWMPLYIKDYLADTRRLRAAEHGAYLLLIMEYWQTGCLPDDDRQLARIAAMSDREWKVARPIIEPLFMPGWRHKRIDAEMATAQQMMTKRSAAGKAGASARYGNRMAIVRQERMAKAVQTDAPVRVGYLHTDSSPSLEGRSAASAKEGLPEEATAPAPAAAIPISSALASKYTAPKAVPDNFDDLEIPPALRRLASPSVS